MSLTLRDAQHLSWKTFKKLEAIAAIKAENFGSGAELVRRAEEIAVKLKMLRSSSASQGKGELDVLLSQLIFSVFIVAERSGISLEESFLQTVDEMILSFVR